jgi:hypothetical protein
VASLALSAVLAYITYKYVKLTKDILQETSKARVAAENSAAAPSNRPNPQSGALNWQSGNSRLNVGKRQTTSSTQSSPHKNSSRSGKPKQSTSRNHQTRIPIRASWTRRCC